MKYVIGIALAVLLVAASGSEAAPSEDLRSCIALEDFDAVIAVGQEQLRSHPDSGETHYWVGWAYFSKDLELAPQSEAYADSSRLFVARAFASFSKARKLATPHWGGGHWSDAAVEHLQTMFGRHYNRGVIAAKDQDHAKAVLEYSIAGLADPNSYRSYYARANVRWALAHEAELRRDQAEFMRLTDEVINDLQTVIELEADDWEAVVHTYKTKGDVLQRRKQGREAAVAYSMASKIDPENVSILRTLAELHYNQENWQAAVESFRRMLEIKKRQNRIVPEDASSYSALGNALLELDRLKEAIEAYERALKLNPSHAMTLYKLRQLQPEQPR